MPAEFHRLVIVGVGLIGGSIALAARRRGVAEEVIGVVRSEQGRARAIDAGVVETATTDLEEAASSADLLVVATPVSSVATQVLQAATACPPSALLTDAGSTKETIVQQVASALEEHPAAPVFVGSHPLAGDHRTGPESARDDLLEGRRVVVTPTEDSPPDAVDRITQFWRSLGAETVSMSPAQHDDAVARTSHLPHVMAAALAAATPPETLDLAASGWCDTTRVAAGSPALWRDILLDNQQEVLASIADFDGKLAEFRQALANGDGDTLEKLLDQGRERRDAVGD